LDTGSQEGLMIFSVGHILLTAAMTSGLALIIALWRLPRAAWPDILAITVLSGGAVVLWRLSANMPALNDDGLPGFSANDWAAPVLTFVFLSLYADLRVPADSDCYRQARALTALAALAVNVITI
jgi:hypothetical protein